MIDSPQEAPVARWTALRLEAQVMRDALNTFPLLGVQDREGNHIAAMQEEIDTKAREALMAYWIAAGRI
jgi:hypothetical protein